MSSQPIDFNNWKRREIFYYFSKMSPTGYSMTVEVDITHLRQTLKAAGKKFYPVYLWLATKCLQEQEEFMIAEADGVLGSFDRLTPSTPSSMKMTRPFPCSGQSFWRTSPPSMRLIWRISGSTAAIMASWQRKDALPPKNAYTVSCIPWVGFKHFAVHSYENKPYYFPSVEVGRFYEKDGRTLLPLSLTCHHATTDGYHIKEFLRTFQNYADHFEQFL